MSCRSLLTSDIVFLSSCSDNVSCGDRTITGLKAPQLFPFMMRRHPLPTGLPGQHAAPLGPRGAGWGHLPSLDKWRGLNAEPARLHSTLPSPPCGYLRSWGPTSPQIATLLKTY
ncbi:hypothetical protein E2C01_095721 [Portunus trituberculatus]|uniref:Uncharacterized protein n=1 Tax=Portunus trituberculatus TaxID=210409 RepID=A0A5B7JTR6_PORTR|nr:hypothetical protein [Portunus trituberculatus]